MMLTVYNVYSSCMFLCFELNANLNEKATLTRLGMNLWISAVFEEHEKRLPLETDFIS